MTHFVFQDHQNLRINLQKGSTLHSIKMSAMTPFDLKQKVLSSGECTCSVYMAPAASAGCPQAILSTVPL